MNIRVARLVYKSIQADEDKEVARLVLYSVVHRKVTQGCLFMV